ncbi:MAG: HD domain-containing protein [Lachnospiraceae bacterium]|nr:HD domain-containing protein [Lachnospiraceae bacterium]
MSRIIILQTTIHQILNQSVPDPEKRAVRIAHLHGVALAAVMLAKRRGEDAELAAMAGLLHDVYAYIQDSYEDHAHQGADYARTVLQNLEF